MNSWQLGSVSLGDAYSQGNYANAQKAQKQTEQITKDLNKNVQQVAEDFSAFVDTAIHIIDTQA